MSDPTRQASTNPARMPDTVLDLHLRLAQSATQRQFSEVFGDLGITQTQLTTLLLIADNPGTSQADIGRALQMDRATVMGIINRLEGRSLIERGQSSEDRRRQTLYMTPAGTAMLPVARDRSAQVGQWLRERFSDAEFLMLGALLKRIHGVDIGGF
ncbi:MarR family winged helix-turn-helix transcriptional regulator [Sphingobium sp. CAP-1]|uniref:MarR family winged helix-turn-helix transcriptional regulator n=1 Tax=Sphingobium sp. CAP-1 TaxID=2676077 RepID=UPI0012BB248C|nr:MarR family transcriptional regulator [Sphingobium sp. CAP-1]QGP80977.1 MarR family transcriptional regulator [Sphingobium sp. CAP-1]